MRVSRDKIIQGVTEYIKGEILPKMDKTMQIIGSIAVNAAATNEKIVDGLFGNGMVMALLEDDGSGMYEVSNLMDAVKRSIDQYGNLPIQIPAIPFISKEITLTLNAGDIDAMKRRMEMA